jgi:hypothetical protein
MAAYRKKYASLENDEPVTAPPSAGAKLPDPVEPKPIESPTVSNPVKEAEQAEISKRLAEVERATQSAPQPQQSPPPQADDPDEQARLDEFRQQLEEAIAPLPNEDAKRWFRLHPEYLFDQEKSAQANHYHYVTTREAGEPFTPQWFERFETNLGLRQPAPPQQRQAPLARPAGPSVGYAAPPTREAPSMSTGHIPSDGRVRLTKEEVDFAKQNGISLEDYAKGKLRLRREREAGMHPHG